MSLEKVIKIDQIEIVGDYKAIQVRTATVVTDDGKELSRSFHRHSLNCDADISGEEQNEFFPSAVSEESSEVSEESSEVSED